MTELASYIKFSYPCSEIYLLLVWDTALDTALTLRTMVLEDKEEGTAPAHK